MAERNEQPIFEEVRRGFLPINANAFDRVFISVILLIAIHLLWMRFLESFLPLEIATLISIVLGFFIIRKG
ncbi:MAG: hypothetical protein IPK19_17525 [Chloroflexi bacterium]|nr:hypothetical protein [Chloroflexota bacterium]